MIDFLIKNPFILLFLVAAIGYAIGQIKVAGVSLGVAAVLFVGLGFGALDPKLKVPTELYEFGLIFFVYTVGLASGRSFIQAFRRNGLRDNLFIVAVLLGACGLIITAKNLFDLKPAYAVGIFTGSLTNTPSMAAAIEYLRTSGQVPANQIEAIVAEPVVGYSVAYPVGVIGMLLAIIVWQNFFRINYGQEAADHPELGATNLKLVNITGRVTNPALLNRTIAELTQENRWKVIFGRIKRGGLTLLAQGNTTLEADDLVGVIGTSNEVERVVAQLGERTDESLERTRESFDYRRIFVSNNDIVGIPLRDLRLQERFGAIITRVRRGDKDFLPNGETVLELGDRVRVVGRRERMDEISAFFGDSFTHISEINVMTFSLGLALGLLAGTIPLPLPGGITFKLGLAGGPLVVALILSSLERTGKLVWTLPYNANLTIRQIGLVIFLAGVGTKAGYPFVDTLTKGPGLLLFGIGALVTCSVALLTLFVGYKLLKIPYGVLIGMLAGLQTQPAVLSFARDQARNELPEIGYATVYPAAIIAKIILAQVLMALML
jgi:putative transport protein